MAINVFRNITHNVTTETTEIYTTPAGFSGIVLMAQVTNVTPTASVVSMSVLTDSVETFLAYEFSIPGNDSGGLLSGKLVLEAGQRLAISGGDDGSLQLVMSILESQN
jgi:hypothetical protein